MSGTKSAKGGKFVSIRKVKHNKHGKKKIGRSMRELTGCLSKNKPEDCKAVAGKVSWLLDEAERSGHIPENRMKRMRKRVEGRVKQMMKKGGRKTVKKS